MWSCKKCGSKKIGVRIADIHSTTFTVKKIDKSGEFIVGRKVGKVNKSTFGNSYECLECGNLSDSGNSIYNLKNIAFWIEQED